MSSKLPNQKRSQETKLDAAGDSPVSGVGLGDSDRIDSFKIGPAAKLLGVSIDTLRRWEAAGKISTIRTPGGTRLYTLEEIQRINPEAKVHTPAQEAPKRPVVTQNLCKSSIPWTQIYAGLAIIIIVSAIITGGLVAGYLIRKEQVLGVAASGLAERDCGLLQPLCNLVQTNQSTISAVLSPFDYLAQKSLQTIAPQRAEELGFPSPSPLDRQLAEINEANKDLLQQLSQAEGSLGDLNTQVISLNLLSGQVNTTGSNLIKNSSFEANSAGQPSFWSYMNESTDKNTFVNNASVRTGNMALRIEPGGGKSNFGIYQPSIKTIANHVYTLSLYVRNELGSSASLKLSFWDKNNNRKAVSRDFTVESIGDWRRYSFSLDPPSQNVDGNEYYPMIEILTNSTSGNIYIDDVDLSEGLSLPFYNIENQLLGDGSIIVDSNGKIYPASGGSGSLGSDSLRFSSLYLSQASIDSSGNASLGGTLTVSGSTTFNSSVNLSGAIGTSLAPVTDNLYDLGSSTYRWNDLFLGGDAVLAGDIAVNGGDLTTANTIFNLLNTTATTLNIGGAATTVSLGASTGTTTINNNLTISGTTIFSDALTVSGLSNLNGGIAVDTSNFTVSGSTGAVTTASTITLADDQWIGLGASKGLIEFDDTTTDEVNILNANVGIGTAMPDYLLELNDSTNTPTFALSDDDIAHGVTTLAQTDSFFHLSSISTTDGGAQLTGLADATGIALGLKGVQSSDPTDTTPAISLIGAKASGTGVQDLADAETVLQIANNDNTAAFTILGNGNVGIGTTTPGSRLNMAGGILDIDNGVLTMDRTSSSSAGGIILSDYYTGTLAEADILDIFVGHRNFGDGIYVKNNGSGNSFGSIINGSCDYISGGCITNDQGSNATGLKLQLGSTGAALMEAYNGNGETPALFGATHANPKIDFANYAADSGYFMQIRNINASASSRALDITNAGSGVALFVTGSNGSSGTALQIGQSGAAHAVAITKDTSTTGNALNLTNSVANTAVSLTQSGDSVGLYMNKSGTGAGNALQIDNAGSGIGLYVNNTGSGYGAILTGGNVGVGTAVPVGLLDVAGAIYGNNTNNYLDLYTSGNVNLFSRGSMAFRFDSDNNQTDRTLTISHDTGTAIVSMTELGLWTINPVTTGTVFDFTLATEWTTGTIINGAYASSTTQTGDIIGLKFDFDTNLTGAADSDITGTDVVTNALTQSSAVTTNYIGYNISAAGALTQNTAAGTINWRGMNITLPVVTQTTGTVAADGLRVLIPASGAIVTAGTMNGINVIAPTTSGPAAGTLNGVNIGALASAGAGTENALNIGSGWDSDINATTSLELGIGGTNEAVLSDAAFYPATSDGNALGSTSNMWSDLFLASGGVINFDNGDVTLTHTTDTLTLGGGALTITGTEGSNMLTVSAGDAVISDGSFSVTDDDDATSFSLTNNTAATVGAGVNTDGIADISSTSLSTGNLVNLETTTTLSSGRMLNITSTSTALTSGNLLRLDWTPGSATTATGDLFSLNIGANGTTTGNLFNILDSSSSIFSISETAITTSLPASFNAAGDVSFAYDLNFTNPSAAFIKSAAPLYLQSGESFNSSDLVLQTYNAGSVVIQSGSSTATSVTGLLDIDGVSATSSFRSVDISTTFSSTAASASGYGLYNAFTNSNSTNANTAYGGYFTLSDAVALANTDYGLYTTVSNTGALNAAATKTIYGSYISASGTGATTNASVATTVYGQYITTTATHASDNGTVNQYGLYVADGTSGTNGTSSKFGLYLAPMTGADSNYGICFDCDGTFGTQSVATGIQWGTDATTANNIALYRSANGTATLALGDSTVLLSASATAFNINLSDTTTYTEWLCHNGADGATGPQDIGDCNQAGAGDLGEYYGSDGTLEAGDLVIVDPDRSAVSEIHPRYGQISKAYVTKNTQSYQPQVIGIVSTNPVFYSLSKGVFVESDKPVVVALAGRVPVKVSLENGPISKGDYLTSSSIPGVAMKATKPGQVIGKALEGFGCSTSEVAGTDSSDGGQCQGKILTFVNVSYADPGNVLAGLMLDMDGTLVIPKIRVNKLELSRLAAEATSLDPSDLTLVGTPISSEEPANYIEVAAGLRTLERKVKDLGQRMDSLEEKEASQAAALAKAEESAKVLAEQIASQSARLAVLESTISSPEASASSTWDGGQTDSSQVDILGLNTLLSATPSASFTSNYTLSTIDATISGTLKSLGETFLGNTTLAGNFTVDGTMGISGSSINSLACHPALNSDNAVNCGILYLQNSPLANLVDMFNGKVKIDKEGQILAQTITASEYKVAAGKAAGTGKILAGSKSAEISNTLVNPKSRVLVTPTVETGLTLAVTAKAAGEKFVVTLSQPAPQDITFDWFIINEAD